MKKKFEFFSNPFEVYKETNLCGHLSNDIKFYHLNQKIPHKKTPNLFAVEKASVLGNSNIIVNKNSHAVFDSFVFSRVDNKIFGIDNKFESHENSPYIFFHYDKIKEFDEGIFLGGSWNIGHWLFNHLTKLIFFPENIMQKVPLLISDVGVKEHFLEFLNLFKIKKKNIIFLKKNTLYKFNKVYHPTMPWHVDLSGNMVITPYAIDFLRKKTVKTAKNIDKKIYIPRGNAKWRKVLNEKELINLLLKYNFKIIYPEHLSLNEQIKIGSETKWLITPFGASVNFFIFMPPGSSLLQLSSLDRKCMNQTKIFCKFSGINCFETKELSQNKFLELDDDVKINLKELEKFLKTLDF